MDLGITMKATEVKYQHFRYENALCKRNIYLFNNKKIEKN